MRGTERVHRKLPLRFQLLLIVTRMGRDYRPGPRQQIEQVARQGSSITPLEFCTDVISLSGFSGSYLVANCESIGGIATKPFLKWAGGKRWLVERHSDALPRFNGRYIEPFLGGGSVFFHLSPLSALISDSNARLIECYIQVRDNHREVVRLLEEHQKLHSETHYYKVRAKIYDCETEKAAQFLYLNRTCFNGLYRVNMNGFFNVPIGTKSKVIDESESFSDISEALSKAEIRHCDFEETIDRAVSGDFVFVDPPYTVKHNLNGFLKYNEKIFSWDDQVRLRDAIVRASKRGAKVLITNAAHTSVVELYEGVGELRFVKRSSVLAGKSSARGSIEELLVAVG